MFKISIQNFLLSSSFYKSKQKQPWYLYAKDITSIEIQGNVAPTNTAFWFADLPYVQNIDVTNLNTSKVTNMSNMFSWTGVHSKTFSIYGLESWDTSNAINMGSMFEGTGQIATSWSIGDLSKWNTRNVTEMDFMFSSAGENAASWSIGDLSNWNVSNVTTMNNMFSSAGYKAEAFSLNLSNWDVSNVTNMASMFKNCKNLKTIYVSDLWNTSKVTSSTSMFTDCTALVGGNGTVYSSSYTDKAYARIDTAETPGYLTASANMKTYN